MSKNENMTKEEILEHNRYWSERGNMYLEATESLSVQGKHGDSKITWIMAQRRYDRLIELKE